MSIINLTHVDRVGAARSAVTSCLQREVRIKNCCAGSNVHAKKLLTPCFLIFQRLKTTPRGLSLVYPLSEWVCPPNRRQLASQAPPDGQTPLHLRVSARWSDAPEDGHASSTTVTSSVSVLEGRHKGMRDEVCYGVRPLGW